MIPAEITNKRFAIFSGHYGSGKTSAAVSFAESLAEKGERVCIADIDIVNPYFRTKDYSEEFRAKGIRLIVSDYANTNVDMPALPGELYSMFSYPEERIVIDLGGDDRGALALGRWRDGILESNNYEMLFVINACRPLTATVEDCLEVLRETEVAAGMKATAIVNNSNLGDETDEEVILKGVKFAEEFSQATGLPLVANCITSDLYGKLKDRVKNPFPVTRR